MTPETPRLSVGQAEIRWGVPWNVIVSSGGGFKKIQKQFGGSGRGEAKGLEIVTRPTTIKTNLPQDVSGAAVKYSQQQSEMCLAMFDGSSTYGNLSAPDSEDVARIMTERALVNFFKLQPGANSYMFPQAMLENLDELRGLVGGAVGQVSHLIQNPKATQLRFIIFGSGEHRGPLELFNATDNTKVRLFPYPDAMGQFLADPNLSVKGSRFDPQRPNAYCTYSLNLPPDKKYILVLASDGAKSLNLLSDDISLGVQKSGNPDDISISRLSFTT